ncbi:hypothetical protein SAMD00079811_41600 [Scytonema sp. HK-05]|uniref:hypothetical protein n=1 Tax=Scytonema sp. HK-05 TaxID=1137095 RepID=UPI0009358238|nr:hypothetical protein [Scytonema sp. HK-05]OKH57157.1 hypothetical protein NIES2130_21620 [Scytonema sp. HK-05]BAY46548.1 hypothetical protein SAMD00079811_41600 [Scytonema sp. HK-05]
MSRRHYPPAHLRYLKARLWNLSRPGFWGAAIFLSVVGLTIKEYWANPSFFTDWQKNQFAANQPAKSSLSEEDRAIAADIDSLPVLFNTDSGNENSPAARTTKPTQKTQAKNSRDILLEALNSKSQTSATDDKSKASVKEGDSAPAPKLENPFVTQAENLLQLKNFQSGSNSQAVNALTPSFGQQDPVKNSFGLGTGLADTTRPNQNIASESALQTALNQSKNQNQPNLNGTTSTQKNLFEQSQLSNQNRSSQIIPSTGLSPNTINPNIGTGSTQSGLISGTGYIQPPVTNGLQNSIPGTGYSQPGFNNLLPQNSIPGTGYIQPRVTNQQQNSISGTSYSQPSANSLLPQTPISGAGYIQPGISNQQQNSFSRTANPQPGFNNLLPQNPISGAAYPQPQRGLRGIPQTPSAVPDRSAILYDQIMRNRLNITNSGQPLPSVAQPASVVSPYTSATPNNIAPYYTPNQGSVTSNTPVIPNTYGNSGLQQSPGSVPQSIYSSPGQIPGQYTGGGQINRY